MSARIVLVQCTSQKREETTTAARMYDPSDYFRKQRAYARAIGDRWFIQSAKHGLLEPETEIEPYDVSAHDLDDPELWADSIALELGDYYPEANATVEILGGAAYADPLTPELERIGFEVLEPLRGQGIGTRKRSLMEMTNRPLEAFK